MLRKNFPGRKRQRRVVALRALHEQVRRSRGFNKAFLRQKSREIATLERRLEGTNEYRNA